MTEQVKQQLQALPRASGVYLFKDTRDNVLYVGKAKILKNRVRSYFRLKSALDPAKQRMVEKITSIETIAVNNENEALVLEANLIQQHQPPYNVILRDDKYYLFIKITKEEYPRIILTRRLNNDGARYFGPYSSARAVRSTLKLLRRIFPFKEEKESPREKIFPHPLFAQGAKSALRSFSEGGLPSNTYHNNIHNIIRFLQGKRDEIVTTLKEGMEQASSAHQYERAGIFRDQLQAIERLEGDQNVYLPRRESFDCISVATQGTVSAANVFGVRNGKLLNKNTFLLRHRSAATAKDLLRQFILQYYRVAQDIPNTVFIPEPLHDQKALAQWINTSHPPTFRTPQRGKKRQLIKMGQRNAEQLLHEQEITFMQNKRLKAATADLAQAVGLPAEALKRIETYDVSNIQGQLATASMVVFIDGKPDPRLYRKFRLRSEGKPNDTAMLHEALYRRFSKHRDSWPLPDLIIIDGGKGQLSAATALLDAQGLTVPAAALAKREEELFLPGQAQPVRLPYNADALYLLQRMRDEAHRFTLTYHRLLRSKKQKKSLLDDIPNIGSKTKQKLLRHFGSLKAIRNAPREALIQLIGPSKTKTMQEYL